jgi:NitT/TauT family transport system ATP-binding protein
MLQLTDIQHRYGQTVVLDRVSLTVTPGQVVALTGPSGCGKTTLLHIAAHLLTSSAGRVENQFRQTAFMFQEPRLLPWHTALDNIAFGLKARGMRRRERHEIAATIAERLGLAAARTQYPHQLSGGMRQRVALGRALAIDADLLLMDEPFSALDIGLRRELQNLVLRLLAERGLAALVVSHDLTEAVRLCDELLVLSPSPGRVVYRWQQQQPPAERSDSYLYATVAALVREPPVAASFGLHHT